MLDTTRMNVWTKQKGLFKGTWFLYGADYQPTIVSRTGYLSFPSVAYENFTVQGTRLFIHSYSLFQNATDQNSTGGFSFSDSFGHSTYEKDASAALPVVQNGIAGQEFSLGQLQTLPESNMIPVGNNTIYTSTFYQGFFYLTTRTCLDQDCNAVASMQELYAGSMRLAFSAGFFNRVNTVEEWTAAIDDSYQESNIPEEDQLAVPMATDCLLSPQCFTDEQFCDNGDPSCSTSPYQEPDGKVKPGVIAAFTVGGVIIAVIAVMAIIHSLLRRQAKRNRVKFARCVAENMSIRKSARSLTPERLEKEFNKIDTEHGGRISKEALWEFLNSGKAGEINERDFQALWSVMDADKSGSVDFLEFCAFMARCHDEYNEAARANRGSIAIASSLARQSVARSVSVKVAEASAASMDPGNDEEEEEQKEAEPEQDT